MLHFHDDLIAVIEREYLESVEREAREKFVETDVRLKLLPQ